MKLYIFRCSTRQNITGLTPDDSGSNLPVAECPGGNWVYWKSYDINLGEPGGIGATPTDVILAAIKRDGYFINHVTIQITESEL